MNQASNDDRKITKLTSFVWRLRRVKHDNGHQKLTAEEAILNNRENR